MRLFPEKLPFWAGNKIAGTRSLSLVGQTYLWIFALARTNPHRLKSVPTERETHGSAPHSNARTFEQAVLPHLDAAYNLARWLTRNEQDAQDVTQEAFLRAFRFFEGYQGGNMPGLAAYIVRNTCYTWLAQNAARRNRTVEF